jgi:signal transduction histidine kinase
VTVMFLPVERAGEAALREQAALFAPDTPQRELLDLVPNGLVVLNPERQIVYANEAFCAEAGEPAAALLGRRIGEALACVYSDVGEDGCGTSEFCASCGAARAQRRALGGEAALDECRIRRDAGGEEAALELRVWGRPLVVAGTRFMIFALADVSHEKRRYLLERIFFHDIANTAGFIQGAVEMLALRANGGEDGQAELFTRRLQHAAERLLDEIEGQRLLQAAEHNRLELAAAAYSSLALLQEQVHFYAAHPVAARRILRLDAGSDDVTVVLDAAVLGRVLGNMIKNALEACAPGETATAGCRADGGAVQFWVHNPGMIAPAVQHQIFQRTFSTRGPDRGLGTYSMKLLGEGYLGGRVSFTSSEEGGTVFEIAGDWGSGIGDQSHPRAPIPDH